jgi:phosphatidylglycerol:prolipoprotein diacylglycerol transferase
MFPIFFKIGPVTIYYYGVFVFLGVLLGYFVSLKEAQRHGLDKNIFSNIVFWSLAWAFLGAKLLYVLLDFRGFLADPLNMVRAGFVFYGGIIFGFLAFYSFVRRKKGEFRKFADTIALGIPLAHAFGRIGCFSYGCCYGKKTSSFMGVTFPAHSPAGASGTRVIPTQLIESFFLLLIFSLLFYLRKRKEFDGQIFLFYLISYSTLRFIIEFFRADDRGVIFFLSTSQFISIVIFIISVFLWHKWKDNLVLTA